MLVMGERIRLTFDIPDRVRRALNIEASKLNLTVGEVIERLVEENLSENLAIADKAIADGAPPSQIKRGRKPKND